MLSIELLEAYLSDKIWSQGGRTWTARLWSLDGGTILKFRLAKFNKNCYSYRLYDADGQCLLRGATIHQLAAYIAPLMVKARREKREFEAILFWLWLYRYVTNHFDETSET